MQTPKDRGTAEPSADRWPPGRDRWRETWPAMAALASALPAATILAPGCAYDINMLEPAPRGDVDLGNMLGMENNDFGRNSPQFRSAAAACRNLLPPGIADDGSGP